MKDKRLYFIFGSALSLVFLIWSISSCSDGKTNEKDPNKVVTPAMPDLPVPDFKADSAYAFIQKQVDFGPRVPNTGPHIECGIWLENKLRQYGAQVQTQEALVNAFDGTPLRMKNIIASYQPEKANRILLTAHWDTRPFADEDTERRNEPILGANDGASGVGVLLEMARLFQTEMPRIGVDIILWDAEDYGQSGIDNSYCLGSQYWAKKKHKANYQARYGINLDMVGAEGAIFPKEGFSMQYASNVVTKIWSTGQRLGYGAFFSSQRVPGIIDDHVYMNSPAGIKSVDIIHLELGGGFFEHWHTHGDNMEAISVKTLKAVGQTLAEVVYKEQ
jgi:glutaminyl-peptide cyclotransferase